MTETKLNDREGAKASDELDGSDVDDNEDESDGKMAPIVIDNGSQMIRAGFACCW